MRDEPRSLGRSESEVVATEININDYSKFTPEDFYKIRDKVERMSEQDFSIIISVLDTKCRKCGKCCTIFGIAELNHYLSPANISKTTYVQSTKMKIG
jgi:hypothetical protein